MKLTALATLLTATQAAHDGTLNPNYHGGAYANAYVNANGALHTYGYGSTYGYGRGYGSYMYGSYGPYAVGAGAYGYGYNSYYYSTPYTGYGSYSYGYSAYTPRYTGAYAAYATYYNGVTSYPYRYSVACNSTQRRSADGSYCISCPTYTRANVGNTGCVSNTCAGYNAVLMSNGACKSCAAGNVADSTRRTCVATTYSSGYYYPNGYYTNGYYNTPVAMTYFKEEIPEEEAAAEDTCNPRQFLNAAGDCESCGPFSRAQNTWTMCAHDVCKENQIQTSSGSCSTCPEGKVAGDTGRECVQAAEYFAKHTECAPNSVVDRYGGCAVCPDGSWVDSTKSNCFTEQEDGETTFISVGSELEAPVGDKNLAVTIAAIGGVILCLGAATAGFMLKTRKIIYDAPAGEASVEGQSQEFSNFKSQDVEAEIPAVKINE